ncbi:hypothetical protein GCM10010254_22920 [Streptomyces chromofuscus]|nr:hypothetical protein GCM10010254_22920 [Streptomyces chromofuscus]
MTGSQLCRRHGLAATEPCQVEQRVHRPFDTFAGSHTWILHIQFSGCKMPSLPFVASLRLATPMGRVQGLTLVNWMSTIQISERVASAE